MENEKEHLLESVKNMVCDKNSVSSCNLRTLCCREELKQCRGRIEELERDRNETRQEIGQTESAGNQ